MQEEPKTSFLINFIVRAVVGMGLIFLSISIWNIGGSL